MQNFNQSSRLISYSSQSSMNCIFEQKSYNKMIKRCDWRSASTGSMWSPWFPSVSAQFVDVESTVEVSSWITGSAASTACSPVNLNKSLIYCIDLPQANIWGAVGVIGDCVGIACRLMRDNAFATILIPCRLGAPSGDIDRIFAHSTETSRAVAGRAVLSACVGEG